MNTLITNPEFLKNKNFLLARYDESGVHGATFEEYYECYAKLFHPHPEEGRLGYFDNEHNYFEDWCNTEEHSWSDDKVSVFKGNFDHYVGWYLKLTGLKFEEHFDEMGVEFYKKSMVVAVDLMKKIVELLKDDTEDLENYKAGSSLDEFIRQNLWEEIRAGNFKGLSFEDDSIEELSEDEDEDSLLKAKATLEEINKLIVFFEEAQTEEDIIFASDSILDLLSWISQEYPNGFEPSTGIDFYVVERVISQVIKNLYISCNPNVRAISLYEHSGMCLQHSSTCRWDSTGGAALILGNKDLYRDVFKVADNVVQGNVWLITQYALVKAEEVHLYDTDELTELSDLNLDKDELKTLEVEDPEQWYYVEYDTVGGFLCEYKDWDYAGVFDHFEPLEVEKLGFEIVKRQTTLDVKVQSVGITKPFEDLKNEVWEKHKVEISILDYDTVERNVTYRLTGENYPHLHNVAKQIF